MRNQLSVLLRDWGLEIEETFGPSNDSESMDYPDVARDLCHALLESVDSKVPALGLLVCGTGQGMAITANKIAGIRAGVVGDPFSARMIREHNNANVICLGQRVLGTELAGLILRSFVESEFTEGRHIARVNKISELED